MVWLYWFRIVLTPSSRWDEDRKTSLPSSSPPPLFGRVLVVVTLFVLASFPPLPGLSLSFFSVDGLQRTDFRRNTARETSSFFPILPHYPFPSGERTKGPMRRVLERFPKLRQDKRRHDGGDPRERIDPNDHQGKEGEKGKREVDKGMMGVDWDSVTILDEHELEDEVEAGRTRIHLLPEGRHISTFLNRGMNGRFLFLNSKQNESLAIVITPCNSILQGSINYLSLSLSENTTRTYLALKRCKVLETFRTQRTVSFNTPRAERGVYMLEIRPIYSNTYLHLLATTSPEYSDPFDLSMISSHVPVGNNSHNYRGTIHIHNFLNTNHVHPKPWVGVKRLRESRVQVKWDPSPINPHRMNYCIVVNTRKDYASLCGAQGDKFGFLPPDLRHLPIYPLYPEPTVDEDSHVQGQGSIGNELITKSPSDDIVVGCLRRKTNYILSDLQEGVLYFVNIFVKDVATGLSYPYVRTMLKYTAPKRDPNYLRDAIPTKVVLGPEMVTLHFNVKKPCGELALYVMPCGGGVISYKVLTANHTLYQGSEVDSLDIIKMAFPLTGKYFIQLVATQGHGMARMAEVFVSKKQKKFPLPKLPAVATVSELVTERRCDAVTVQWKASPDLRDNEYCIFLKEETRKREFHFKKPNQCDVERSLQSDPYVSLSFCLQKMSSSQNEGKLLTERITGLKPSTLYILQLIVKKHNGRSSLSYDLTVVTTSQTCLDE